MNGLHSTSLGSRINCTNSSSSQIAKSPVHNSLRKNYQSSGGISGISGNLSGNFSGNSYQKSISTSPITVTTMSDGRVERRLETCSYQETEMVRLNRIIHGVPPICWQFRTQFSIFLNQIFKKVRPLLKFLWKKYFWIEYKKSVKFHKKAWCNFFAIWHFIYIRLEIFLVFKVPSGSSFHKNFKKGLTFWHIWFWKIENVKLSTNGWDTLNKVCGKKIISNYRLDKQICWKPARIRRQKW